MIIYGGGGNAIRLSDGDQLCPDCESEQIHSLVVVYKYHHLYYLGVVYHEEYLLICNGCKRTVVQNAVEVFGRLAEDPIPLHHRYGCLILIVIISAIIVLSVLLGR